ncbi:hypothetical protein NEOLEDRAFT_384980 [Neolentinus lepideus HHB14362 ss-1]|uniref:Secreted protein n=1 Tax=Neolentinus lepideus HHB14362 ss-1 TaxID=1314782 RepID=A0A165SE90_9AGAM|nr:hypothetical protein NEOLEDRAFT_384980 [Neolentinus lepideus HHB14362 ss-1]
MLSESLSLAGLVAWRLYISIGMAEMDLCGVVRRDRGSWDCVRFTRTHNGMLSCRYVHSFSGPSLLVYYVFHGVLHCNAMWHWFPYALARCHTCQR